MAQENKLIAIDLFCGAGGLSYGFQQAGFTIIAGLDNDIFAQATYTTNFPKAKFYSGDIKEIKPERVMSELGIKPGELDCLIGGPPCQGFSVKGNMDLSDDRNLLFKFFMRFVFILKPKAVLIENVPPILTLGEERFQKGIRHLFRRYGYRARFNTLMAAEYGVPQKRKRAFFLALRDHKEPTFPVSTHAMRRNKKKSLSRFINVREAIGDLPSLRMGKEVKIYTREPRSEYQRLMRGDQDKVFNHDAKIEYETNITRIRHLKQGQGMKDLSIDLQPKSGYSQAYGRLSNKGLATTVTANMHNLGSGRYIHPTQNRAISVREGARLQSFDDKFVFYGSRYIQCRQVGNAVPPLLAKAIAIHIKNNLL
jgi:DNA (cytosine-5)-methyltransferase 1